MDRCPHNRHVIEYCAECATQPDDSALKLPRPQESTIGPCSDKQNIAQINEWLLDYIGLMEGLLAQHPNPVGLHRLTVNRRLERQIKAVTAYLAEQPWERL